MQAGIKVQFKFFLLPVWFQLSDHQSTLLWQCTEFLSEWDAISSEALPCSYFPCLLQQQCWSLLSFSTGLRGTRLSGLTHRSFGSSMQEQSRGFLHPHWPVEQGSAHSLEEESQRPLSSQRERQHVGMKVHAEFKRLPPGSPATSQPSQVPERGRELYGPVPV